ncbi:MAG: zf-HC2 domain-containing protein [Candidatus Omnitrophica bacterium]|nr:zf-HC2 domain-containing protein [Candidatus Omnitrophota bacterium]
MNCKQVQKLLSGYIDRAVSEIQEREIVLHLESCKTCQREFEQLKKTMEMVRNLSPVSAPGGFAESVMEKIHQKQATTGKLRFWLAGIACAEIVAVVLIYRFQSPTRIVFEPQESGIEMQQKIVEKSLPKTKENRKTIVERKQEKVVYALKSDAGKQEKPEILIQIDARERKTLAFARDETVSGEKNGIGLTDRSQTLVMKETKGGLPSASTIAEKPAKRDTKSEIYQWITDVGGKILSEQQMSETEVSYLIIAEIPGSVYKDFLNNLNTQFYIKNYDSTKDFIISETFVTIRLQIFK